MDSVQWECWDIYSEEHNWDFTWKSLWKDASLKDYVANQGTQTSQVCLCSSTLFSMSKKEARPLFRFLKLVILTSSWTRFHCLSREAKISDCCFDRYKSRASSFRSSWVSQCGSLPLVPEYVDSISSQRYWLGRIFHWRHFFIWWGKKILIYWRCGYRKIIWMGNGSHSRSKLGYLIFFLEDALKPVMLVKQK